ncbi:MAG: DUF433 domain-containing protein [Deltaproteobacteria bacterium]|nr:DUF433 domain-containing protein [Deltaproteobacteria bacterium]
MARIEIGRYLATDTRVCGGRLIFKGTRILVSDALELLRANFTAEQIAREYQGRIVPEAVHEALTLSRKGIVREVLPKTKTAA